MSKTLDRKPAKKCYEHIGGKLGMLFIRTVYSKRLVS
jgi:hypothetical protein